MPGGVTFTQIAAGNGHTCGLGNDKVAYCLGEGARIGDGNNTDKPVPTAVSMPSGVLFVRLAEEFGSHSCALGNNNITYCWGYGAKGQIGNSGNSAALAPTAVTMPSSVNFTQISSGYVHNCAIGSDTKSYCWGGGGDGALGDGLNTNSNIPVMVDTSQLPAPFTRFLAFTTGDSGTTCGLGDDYKTYCWGYNEFGQLGNGTAGSANGVSRPTAVTLPTPP